MNNDHDVFDDGGSAFPRSGDLIHESREGMTLLDWFAGRAVTGFAAQWEDHEIAPEYLEVIAMRAYRWAAAMIRERRRLAHAPANTHAGEPAIADDLPF